MPSDKHTPYYQCLEALTAQGCAICTLTDAAVGRYLDSLIYESVNDPRVRDMLRAAKGFCTRHAWQLRRQGGALGIAIIYRDVVADILHTLDQAHFTPPKRLSTHTVIEAMDKERPASATAELVRALQDRALCPACKVEQRTEKTYVDLLLENIHREELYRALESSEGLCLPHLQMALTRLRSEAVYQRLMAAQRQSLARLLDDLSEMIRRHDYRYQGEGLQEVGDAWIRAIASMVGKQDSS